MSYYCNYKIAFVDNNNKHYEFNRCGEKAHNFGRCKKHERMVQASKGDLERRGFTPYPRKDSPNDL